MTAKGGDATPTAHRRSSRRRHFSFRNEDGKMKKLNLLVEDLAVESFETGRAEPIRGTVRAHGDSSDCSFNSPMYTFCNLTCRIDCGESGECTPRCPRGGTGGGGNPTIEVTACASNCNISCVEPC
jgi:hypothetical protein